MFQKVMGFLREVRAELGKISWPTREELRGSTIVVIVTVILMTVFVGLVDQVFNIGLKFFIRNL